jgi:SAM-dependent methyltransferase
MDTDLRVVAFQRLAPHFAAPRGVLGWVAGRLMLARNAPTNEWLVDVAAPEPDETVVDLGCGPGLAVAAAAARLGRGRVVGIDRAPVLAAMARRRLRDEILDGRADIVVGDAAELPLPDGSVDVVMSLNAYGHWGALAPVAGEIVRVLAPGGRAVIAFRTRRDDASDIDPARWAPDAAAVEARVGELAGRGLELVARVDDTVGIERVTALVLVPGDDASAQRPLVATSSL